jgi:hypothetical protein
MPRTERRRRVWRFARWFALVLFLMLLNWPIGWLLMRYGSSVQSRILFDDQAAAEGWPVSVPSDWPPPQQFNDDRGFGTSWLFASSINQHTVDPTALSTLRTANIQRMGWPMFSVACYRIYKPGDSARDPTLRKAFGWSLDWHDWKDGLIIVDTKTLRVWKLPLIPLPLGLLANTAVMLVPIFAVRFLWKRFFRDVRPYQCRSCDYDLRGAPTAICPECGAAFDRSAIYPKPLANTIDSKS